jgi:hypothetical protein
MPLALILVSACEADVVIDPPDDGGAPGTGGGGATPVAGGGSGGQGPQNPDPTCVPNMTLPDAVPTEVSSALLLPMALVLVGDHVYVADRGNSSGGAIARVPKAGGEREWLVQNLASPWTIAATSDSAYWSSNNTNSIAGTVSSLSLVDESVDVLLTGSMGYPTQLAVYDESVYAIDLEAQQLLAFRPSGDVDPIATIPLAGYAVAADESGVYMGAYETEETGAIYHVDAAGTVTLLYSGIANIFRLLVDGDYLYLSTQDGRLQRGTKEGAPLVTLAEAPDFEATSGVISECFYYFSSSAGVGRVALQGGDVQRVVDDPLNGATAVALDDEAIYWTTGDHRLMRLLK